MFVLSGNTNDPCICEIDSAQRYVVSTNRNCLRHTGMFIPVCGCLVCGEINGSHGNLWHPDYGWHTWIEPTDKQRKQRIRASKLGGLE